MQTPVRNLVLAALFAALTAVAAQLSFRLPFTPVPFTLQVLAVFLAGLLLGARWGAVAMAVYLLLGAVGLPVFAGGGAGLARLVGPTAGYLWSYPIAAAVAGYLARRSVAGIQGPGAGVARAGRGQALRFFLATVPALAVIYAGGAGWALLVAGKPAGVVLAQWVLPFIPYDLVKGALAAAVAAGVARALPVAVAP